MTVFALYCLTISAQQIRISGKVTDENNLPLPGATISILESGNGTSTNLEGEYSIEIAPGNKLQFSYIGYVSQTIPTDNKTVINVMLLPKSESLEEVVVVGYGVQRKANLTGSVSTVNFDQEMSSRP